MFSDYFVAVLVNYQLYEIKAILIEFTEKFPVIVKSRRLIIGFTSMDTP